MPMYSLKVVLLMNKRGFAKREAIASLQLYLGSEVGGLHKPLPARGPCHAGCRPTLTLTAPPNPGRNEILQGVTSFNATFMLETRKSCGNPPRNRQVISFASRRTLVSKQTTLSRAPWPPNKKRTKVQSLLSLALADLTRCLFSW